MSFTQRSEQQNRFFKSFVNSRTGLRQFIKQFDGALRSNVEEEKQKNFACVDTPLRCEKSILVEDVFHKLYTNEKFKEVKEEVLGLLHTNVVLVLEMGSYTKGILCRHIIRCIEIKDVKFIPDKYIVNRWRKDLVRPYESVWVGYYDPAECGRVKRSMEVTLRNDYISRLALQDDESYGIYERGSAEVIKNLESYCDIDNINSYAAGGGSSRVWGRRRLQWKENRNITRNTMNVEVRVKYPIDKRRSRRAPRPRPKTVRKKVNASQSTPSKSSLVDDEVSRTGNKEDERNETYFNDSMLATHRGGQRTLARRRKTMPEEVGHENDKIMFAGGGVGDDDDVSDDGDDGEEL
ncbi:hypothetical protein RND81_14G141200 [Saponaria officinalis]|uniref:Protein FAR1-RELATED SEQUENCE n=1 Tax=Saponaria officinalis TaxID=3572 RepID=A0AAW1GW69_SAPOF